MTTLTLQEKSKTLSMRTNILISMPISKYSTKVKLMMGKNIYIIVRRGILEIFPKYHV